MAIFSSDEAVWQRIDYSAIVNHGLMCLKEEHLEPCHQWLAAHGYTVMTLDCSTGFQAVCAQISRLFKWQEQFGYEFENGNLDALHDGLRFDVPAEGGVVFELLRPDVLFKEDAKWVQVLLDIASEQSRIQLAAGLRLFTLLVVPPDSELLGQRAYEVTVPACWWQPGPQPPFH